MYAQLPTWLQELLPIVILLGVVSLVVARMPKVELGHSPAFIRRRFVNWFPLGMTYAFLYMGRYNITAAKNAGLLTKEEFGDIYGWGALVYGLAFLLNGPLADVLGGRKTILIAAAGAAAMNLAMGAMIQTGAAEGHLVGWLSLLYGLNMYFQSFGAVSVVKVNAPWFHVRERGVFGGIFGILISLGLYFAYDWGALITDFAPVEWVFYIPAVILVGWFVADWVWVRDTPGETGHRDFDTGDASSGDDTRESLFAVAKRMFTNPVILTVALIEFCSGFLRNSMKDWGRIFGRETGLEETFAFQNWGLLMCVGGIAGGMFAGILSDRVFHSRRAPVAGVLYGMMLAGLIVMWGALDAPWVGWLLLILLGAVVSVHGMLSGTASMDFGGTKNAGVAVGLIDGFVYLGTVAQAWGLGPLLPSGDAQADAANWWAWPAAMIPFAALGLLLSVRIWNATPKPRVRAPVPAAAQDPPGAVA